MEIDSAIAAALGFPKTKYTAIERERRWLLSELAYTGGALVKHGVPPRELGGTPPAPDHGGER